ncbi:MAG: YesL family protein [Eubacteriales bacterium]
MKFNLEDTPYGRFACLLFDLILLNILFVICSIPIVTIGASLTSLYYTFYQRTKGENSMIKTFFTAFRCNFLQSTLLWIVALTIGGLLVCNFVIASSFSTYQTLAIRFLMIPTFLYCAILSYAFPLLSTFEHTLKQLLLNSIFMSIAHFPRTILLVLTNLLPMIILLLAPSWIAGMFYIWLPCMFSTCAYISTNLLTSIFASYSTEESEDLID